MHIYKYNRWQRCTGELNLHPRYLMRTLRLLAFREPSVHRYCRLHVYMSLSGLYIYQGTGLLLVLSVCIHMSLFFICLYTIYVFVFVCGTSAVIYVAIYNTYDVNINNSYDVTINNCYDVTIIMSVIKFIVLSQQN